MSDLDISEIIDSQITVEDNFPTREGFGTLLVLGHQNRALDRIDTYSKASDADEDYATTHFLRRALGAAFAQNPRPQTVKIGRRDGAPTQTLRVIPITTTATFEYVLQVGDVEITYDVATSDTVALIIDGLIAAIAASTLAADDDGIVTALATVASTQTIARTGITGVIGGDFSTARKITVTRSSHADQDAVTAVLTYVDWYGRTQTENLAFANGGGDSFTSAYPATRFVSLVIPAQAGTAGTTKVGVAAIVTTTDNTTSMDIAAPAGTWVPVRFGPKVKRADATLEDRTANPGTTVATDLAACLAEDSDFYGVVLADGQSLDQILDAAAWCQENGKLLIAHSADSACADGTSITDVMYRVKDAGYVQASVLYMRNGLGYWPDSCWMGRMLPTTPGTEAWGERTLAGPSVEKLTASELAAIKAKNGNCYVRIGGISMVFGAKRGGVAGSGRFLDLVRYVQALNAALKEAGIVPIVAGDGLPFDDDGLTALAATFRSKLENDRLARILRSFTLTVPKVANIPDADRADRVATGLSYDAIYTGKIQGAQLRGRIGV